MGLQPPSKIVCVGRNYVDHAAELNNPVPTRPLLFMKPPSSITRLPEVRIPTDQGECQHEIELAVYIGIPLRKATPEQAIKAIAGYGVALDLTLRQVQSELKAQGQPWERAKAFDGSCVLGPMVGRVEFNSDADFDIALSVNGERRQHGKSSEMIFTIADLLADISQQFTLVPGDVVLTGTPAGVAALSLGDELELTLKNDTQQWQWAGVVRAAE
ncbi:fumarylacetoacetate hydrolase family protein [Pseudidiomarina andamanensis]|uniref:Fumarylacetoacetate hydrolase family protein n=1 Tax=Pseudidiomarina andamanensis TaxID=1940690 RepID=A0AA92ER19_9GAMM|nr:fumarylacetoacetate hydrolase family protein [Pseudidiomarina andamanensis]MDS0218067.1 fumarylacetoacetate hydrolase family protein [Pseudidiomarina andamanensis]QGT94954.1 fumarylacetoacetate hydrolase family protein [Pseudidiomarina andamanensis]